MYGAYYLSKKKKTNEWVGYLSGQFVIPGTQNRAQGVINFWPEDE